MKGTQVMYVPRLSRSVFEFFRRQRQAARYLRNLTTAFSIAVLPACNSSSNVLSPPPSSSPHGSQTFPFTGEAQAFTVPSDVTRLKVTAYGARGDGPGPRNGHLGILGGFVQATIPVKPGQRLMIFVGGKAKGKQGGFNGGGNAGQLSDGFSGAFGGGGSSDVRTGNGALENRIVVAGGGGGTGDSGLECSTVTCNPCPGGAGGKGGADTGGHGGVGVCDSGGGGSGGSQKSGGAGGSGGPDGGPSLGGSPGCAGSPGAAGTLLNGGVGANLCAGRGGGGGGGYHGGGGGGSGGCCGDPTGLGAGGGGGGGSSFVEKSAINVQQTPGGGLTGNGKITISW